MDPSVLCTDDQTQSRSAPTDSLTGDSDSFLCSPTETLPSLCETGAETLSDPSDTPTEIFSPRNLSQDKGSDSGCLKPLSCSSNMSECFSLGSEPAPKEDEFKDGCYFSPRKHVLPLLPHFSCNLISPLSEPSEFYVKEPALSFSTIQENSAPQPSDVMSSTSEDVMEPFVAEHGFSHGSDHSQATHLSRSLSHQSDSLGSDTGAAPMSDLYIYESETQDFILSPNVDPEEIKCAEYLPLSQAEGENTGHECDMHDLLCDSGNVVTQCHPGNSESGWSQHAGQQTPAVDACEAGWQAVSDATAAGKTEITDISRQSQRSISPVELWLDACQYLTGEDSEERASHSVMQGGLGATSHLSFSVTEVQVSGYSPDGSEGIGRPGSDTIGWGPPVERWSSVDSWASALSDWAGIIAAPSEDFTAAFTAAGAEIDALTKALAEGNACSDTETFRAVEVMGVQDQPLKTQNIPESSVLSGPSCISLCLETTGTELEQREGPQSIESLDDTTLPTQRDEERGGTQNSHNELSVCSPHQQPSVGSSPRDADVTSASTYPADLNIFSNNEDPIILTIIEETDLEEEHDAPGELIITEPFADGLRQVTHERTVAQPGSEAEQKAERRFGLGEVNRGGTKLSTDFLAARSLTDSHVPGADRQPGPRSHVHTHVSSDPSLDFDGACQLEPQWGSPKFITPLAPLGIDSSLICRTRSSLEAAQTCARRSHGDNRDFSRDPVQTCDLSPGSDDITDKSSSEGDDELIHKVDSSNSSSPEGRSDVETSQSLQTIPQTIIDDLSRELSNLAGIPAGHFIISEENRVAYATLDLNDPFTPRVVKPAGKPCAKMPHKTHKSSSESKARSKKDKSAGHHGTPASLKQENLSHHVQQVCKKQETHPPTGENMPAGLDSKDTKLVIDTTVAADKASAKSHGKKKKKHAQGSAAVKSVGEPLAEVENGAKPKAAKGKIDMFEAKVAPKVGKAQKDNDLAHAGEMSQQPEVKTCQAEQPPHHTARKDHQPKNLAGPLNDDIIKRPRLSGDKFGKIVSALESKLPKQDVSVQSKLEEAKVEAGATRKKAYSEVVKQKIPPKEEPKVVKPIQAVAVSGDPQSLSLWCQFSAVFSHHTVTWSRDGTVLSEIKRSAGDESRVSLTVSNASHKDLGKYQCHLSSSHGSVTLDYVLTYEVLSEIVIPPTPKVVAVAPVEGGAEEEDVHCSKLLFKDDFLSDQYFGEKEPASILTERIHFGEGMHRRAFRTKLQAGQIPLLLPGHPCVLKVHNVISVGTKNNEELIQKNFTLAVEECQVQNTAREYIKAYTTVAQSVESFGAIPEIIPIYLVHRPSNDIPYATLEEELIGDFVKYSVKDGKELNLLRRDSEAGQKCCAFQHWVYHKTEGNLLVTDMQGVGMRLTDVGIATCKKGYKGFKGNCATSFIDQFKALHQCNRYCEILGLKSMQPKPRKAASVPKPKPQPSAAPKKKTFGPTLKSKS